jgi:hypothetical protein
LIRDERVQMARPGDTLDGAYKVLSVRSDGVTLVYTPLGIEQQIAFAPELTAGTAAAQERREVQSAGAAPSPLAAR